MDNDQLQHLIIIVSAPSFLILVVITALVIAYLVCKYSKVEMNRRDSNSTVEVVGEALHSTSVSISTTSRSADMSPTQNRGGNILIDEYGIPEDDSNSSSEIMARLPPVTPSPADRDGEGVKLVACAA